MGGFNGIVDFIKEELAMKKQMIDGINQPINGRFRRRLMNMIIKKGTRYNDYKISPVIRQVLLHWGYELTSKDLNKYKKEKK